MTTETAPDDPSLTPRAAARQHTMRRIVELGNAQLSESGAGGLSVREIARGLGMVSSAIYRYVASRDELLTLLSVSRTGSLPMAKASARLQVHPTSVTNAVDRLEAAKLVKRVPHPSDRRATLVEITDAGRELALHATEQLNAKVFADPGLSGDRLQTLIQALAELRHSAGDFDTGGAATKWT